MTGGDMALAGAPGAPQPDQMEKLDRRVVVYWWVTGVLSTLVLCGLLVAGAMVVEHSAPDYAGAVWIGIWIAGGLLLLWALISPPWAYAKWRFSAEPELLRMRYGIFFEEERCIPVSRMQHVDLSRGPIERLFGLATLVVFTAGNEGSAFRVPGIALQRAQELRDQVLAARGDDVL